MKSLTNLHGFVQPVCKVWRLVLHAANCKSGRWRSRTMSTVTPLCGVKCIRAKSQSWCSPIAKKAFFTSPDISFLMICSMSLLENRTNSWNTVNKDSSVIRPGQWAVGVHLIHLDLHLSEDEGSFWCTGYSWTSSPCRQTRHCKHLQVPDWN